MKRTELPDFINPGSVQLNSRMVTRHHVREHTRRSHPVRDYMRGSGSRAVRSSEDYRGSSDLFDHGGASTELTSKQRSLLPPNAFAIPSERAYPVPTVEELKKVGARRPEASGLRHALNALQRSTQHGGEYEKAEVHHLVKSRYPSVYAEWMAGRR
jgi:hypothetical protein